MTDVKLLPCPFCGGPAEVICRAPSAIVSCVSDEPEGCSPLPSTLAPTEEAAIAAWNTRANVKHHTERLQAEVEALRPERDMLAEALRALLELPEAVHTLSHLDRGIGTATYLAAWLRAREALARVEGGGA